MAIATSPVDICNLALDDLKQRPIKSIITPVSDTEYICARNYDTVRQEALCDHPWKFATKRIQLTPNTSTTPLFGYAYAYDLPNDYMRLLTVGDDYLGNIDQPYDIENDQLLAVSGDTIFDGTTKDVRYIRDITDVTKMPPNFLVYFRLLLAVRMSNKFTITPTIKNQLKDDFEQASFKAKAINGQESKIKRIQHSWVLAKRRGLSSGIYASKYTIFDS